MVETKICLIASAIWHKSGVTTKAQITKYSPVQPRNIFLGVTSATKRYTQLLNFIKLAADSVRNLP